MRNGMTENRDQQIARKSRVIGTVIAVAMIAWLAIQFLGGQFGMPLWFAVVMDFAAIAALLWAVVSAAWLWRTRRDDEG